MAESVKEQSSASEKSGSRLLRYPLRSASKKEVKPPVVDSASAVARRGRYASNVRMSVSVLDLSVKEKSAKPPRRLSNPSKTTTSPASRPSGSITPISETRSKGSSGIRGRTNTPVSGVTKSSSKKKFSVLSSSSYWLNQIKHSEAAAKHSLSLGFFRLALEAGCEPLQLIRDELKSYARKHNLAEIGESVNELFEKYNITENFEQLEVSETCSHVPEEGTRSSDEDVRSSSSVGVIELVKQNSSAGVVAETMQVKQQKEKVLKEDSVSKVRKSAANKKPTKMKSTQSSNSQKRPQKTNQGLNNTKVKKSAKRSAHEDSIDALPVQKALEENKENLDTPQVDEISSSEV